MASPSGGTSCESSIQTHEPLGCTSHSKYNKKVGSDLGRLCWYDKTHEYERFLLVRNLLGHKDGCWKVQVSHDRKAEGQCGRAGAFNSMCKGRTIVYNTSINPSSPPSQPSHLSLAPHSQCCIKVKWQYISGTHLQTPWMSLPQSP